MILKRSAVVRVPCVVRWTPVICLTGLRIHLDRCINVTKTRSQHSVTKAT